MTITLRDDEQDVLIEIRRAGGFRSDEDAVKGALFWYARFLDLQVHPGIFALALPPSMLARAAAESDVDQGDLFAEASAS